MAKKYFSSFVTNTEDSAVIHIEDFATTKLKNGISDWSRIIKFGNANVQAETFYYETTAYVSLYVNFRSMDISNLDVKVSLVKGGHRKALDINDKNDADARVGMFRYMDYEELEKWFHADGSLHYIVEMTRIKLASTENRRGHATISRMMRKFKGFKSDVDLIVKDKISYF